jgi:peptidoglycan hydrolase-like protein with peptidoglycan-binding domain
LATRRRPQSFSGPGESQRPTVQRAPLTQADKAQNLTSARYAGDPTLEKAYDNSPALAVGARGDAVAKVQKGLVDDGFAMPKSTKTDGSLDGVFGSETKSAVVQFQVKHLLESKDGMVGRQTMGKLDELGGASPVRKPEIDATTKAMGERVAAGMEKANTTAGPDEGIWYDYNYHAEHLKDPANYPWNEDWRAGLADPVYFDRTDWMDWRLKPGKSASDGIRAWLKGLTIAECLSTIVAIEIDTLRAAIGDDRFDAQFGSSAVPIPESKRLRIQTGTEGTPIEGMLKDAHGSGPGEYGSIGSRPVEKGDWVYFYNHPKYLLKHPGGAWQGENAVFMGDDGGEQMWAGLGAGPMSERDMLQEMADAYSGDRNGEDYVTLLDQHASDTPEVSSPNQLYRDRDTAYTKGLYEKYIDRMPSRYREDSGEFDDTVSVDQVINDPPYTIDGTERKGGYIPEGSSRLDPAKVAAMRGP